jgi:hypothetical protein
MKAARRHGIQQNDTLKTWQNDTADLAKGHTAE